MKSLSFFIVASFAFGAFAAETPSPKTTPKKTPSAVQPSAVQQNDALNRKVLDVVKLAQKKLEAKESCQAELTMIEAAGKDTEAIMLKSVIEMTKKYAQMQEQGSSKEAMEQFEQKRKAAVTGFNELSRLIGQVKKNQNTALLPEKLSDLAAFLEPLIPKDSTPSPLSRGAALKKNKEATKTDK